MYTPVHPSFIIFVFLPAKYFPEDVAPPGPLSGHGGADYHTIKAFVDTLHVSNLNKLAVS